MKKSLLMAVLLVLLLSLMFVGTAFAQGPDRGDREPPTEEQAIAFVCDAAETAVDLLQPEQCEP